MKNADCSRLPEEESKALIEEIILARCNCLICNAPPVRCEHRGIVHFLASSKRKERDKRE
ncbi:MAG TPA: hypothetical protein VGL94_02315 [Ktedonobacteraceae bacterium]